MRSEMSTKLIGKTDELMVLGELSTGGKIILKYE
jgi:hypothetical protein